MLEGEINQIKLVERLVELWREQFTGAIRFESEGIIKILYFKGGDILSASTNDRSDSIDEILMRAGKVSREHVKQALAKRKESETLGDALLNLGFITRKELTWARRVQVVGVIRSIAAWTEGSFTIVADYLPKRDEGTLFPLPQVILELAVTDQDRARYERELEGGNAVFAKTSEFEATWRSLGLNEEAEAIAGEIDGSKSANEIAVASGGETFNVYKLLYGLSLLGLVGRAGPKPQVSPEFSLDDFASAGVADAADLWSSPAAPAAPATDFELDTDLGVSPDLSLSSPASSAEPVVPVSPELSFDEEPVAPPQEPLYQATYDSSFDASPDDRFKFDDEPAPEPPAPVEPAVRLPAWDAPPRQPLAVPIPGSFEPPVEAEEELGGFDEAQLETARRATIPPSAAVPPIASPSRPSISRKKPQSRRGLWIALLALLLVGVGGYFGAQWWLGREPVSETVTPAPAATSAPEVVPETGTVVPLTTSPAATATEVGGDPAATTTVPTATISEVPATATVTPAPTTTPAAPASSTPGGTASPAKARLDAMAQRYAANPSGNFTIQIQILCSPGNLENAMRVGGDAVWFVPQTINGRSCYRVFWGRFQTQEEAQRAMAQIPASLRDRSAAVKPVPGR